MNIQGTKRRGLLWVLAVGVMTPLVLAVGALALAAVLTGAVVRATRTAARNAPRRASAEAPVAALLKFEPAAPSERLDARLTRAA